MGTAFPPPSLALRAAALLLAAACQTGCYTYSPPGAVAPEPAQTFSFALTDHGRAALADRVGAGTDYLEGVLLAVTESTYTVSVRRVADIRRRVVRWNGEVVSFRRDYVGTVRARRLSRGRTALALGGTTAALVGLVATRGLGVLGNDSGRDPGEEPPGGETSRVFPLTLIMNLLRSR